MKVISAMTIEIKIFQFSVTNHRCFSIWWILLVRFELEIIMLAYQFKWDKVVIILQNPTTTSAKLKTI